MSAKSRSVFGSLAVVSLFLASSCGSEKPEGLAGKLAARVQTEAEDGPLGSPPQSAAHAEDLAAIMQTRLSDFDVTPSPACLAAAATGEVFVGVDQIGSLGKEQGKGRIVRLVDRDGDGIADEHTTLAVVNNPRGILPMGDQIFVLHTTFSEVTEAADGMALVVFDDVVDDRALGHAFLADDDGRLAERDAHREVREHLLQVVLQLLSLQHPPRQGYNLQR